MRTVILGIGVCGTLAVSLLGAGAAGGTSARAACTPGQTTFKGVSAVRYCGPAKATVTWRRHTWRFKEGMCVKTSTYVSVSIGEVVLGQATGKPDYFGLAVGKYPGAAPNAKPANHDGTYVGGVVAIVAGGKGQPSPNTLKVKITLKSGRAKGTFSGPAQFETGTVKGSFSC